MYFITSTIPVKENLITSGVLYLQVSLKHFLSTALLSGSVYYVVLVVIFLNFDGLMSYFQSCSEAETSKVINILQRLENHLTKPILSFILPSMDKFNRLFQKSTQNTTCQLYTEMSRLARLYASNVLKPESITVVGEDLGKLSFASENQLADENLGLGGSTWAALSAMEDEFEKNAQKVSIW